jgi:hypothetical protein
VSISAKYLILSDVTNGVSSFPSSLALCIKPVSQLAVIVVTVGSIAYALFSRYYHVPCSAAASAAASLLPATVTATYRLRWLAYTACFAALLAAPLAARHVLCACNNIILGMRLPITIWQLLLA